MELTIYTDEVEAKPSCRNVEDETMQCRGRSGEAGKRRGGVKLKEINSRVVVVRRDANRQRRTGKVEPIIK